MSRTPRVVDLFCGGGGFSEGFRRAGFDVVFANDLDAEACDTYELNHQDTEVLTEDIVDIDLEDIPSDIDVLIGSPPCTEFSYAKNGGSGDIDEGMRLVGEFFRFVAGLEPDYWVMENVPRLGDYLDGEIDHRRIPSIQSEQGTFEVPVREVLDVSDYGTPQRRRRLFSGDYPSPAISGDRPLSLGELQVKYPHPLAEPQSDQRFDDPLYEIEIDELALSDHFYNCYLTEREAEEIRVLKEDHSFYGPMSFPDDTSASPRTVVATNRRIARETIVLEENEAPPGFSHYRKPTIREIASIQGFPITYQFTGDSISKKWRRVGDAVPPTMSYAIALAIRKDMGLEPVIEERTTRASLNYDLNNESFETKGRRNLSFVRGFRHHVPMDHMREFRVDLETTKKPVPEHPLATWIEGGFSHPVRFRSHFYQGYAQEVEDALIDLDTALGYIGNVQDENCRKRIGDYLAALNDEFGVTVPDATTVQAVRSRRLNGGSVSPTIEFDLLNRIGDLVDEHFPSILLGDWTIHCEGLLDGADVSGRVLMKLVGANYVAWKLNYGTRWIANHPNTWYLPQDRQLMVDRDKIPQLLENRGHTDVDLESRIASMAERGPVEESDARKSE